MRKRTVDAEKNCFSKSAGCVHKGFTAQGSYGKWEVPRVKVIESAVCEVLELVIKYIA